MNGLFPQHSLALHWRIAFFKVRLLPEKQDFYTKHNNNMFGIFPCYAETAQTDKAAVRSKLVSCET